MTDSANILLLVSDPLDASISIQRDLLALLDGLRQLEAASITLQVVNGLPKLNRRYAAKHYR